MHRLLAVLSLATALVAPPRRQTTRLRAASLETKGDDYIFEDIAKNLGKGDQDRLYQYQLELAERYGEDKIGRAAPPPKPKKPKQGAAVVDAAREAVVKAVTPATKAVAPRNSKLRWRGLVCGAAVALFLTPGFFGVLDIRPHQGARAREESRGARRGRRGAGDGCRTWYLWRRRARLRSGLRLRRRRRGRGLRRGRARLRQSLC